MQHFREDVRSAKLMPDNDGIKEFLAKCGGPPARKPPTPKPGKSGVHEISLSEDEETLTIAPLTIARQTHDMSSCAP